MKSIFFALSIITCISVSAQKKYSNIINSTNTAEIENFLREAHPDDVRRNVLKRKLVTLKNEKWMNRGKTNFTNTQSKDAYSKKAISQTVISKPASYAPKVTSEEEEFQRLFTETPQSHKDKTVKLLNQIFDNDITNEQAILLIKNTGDCNMIVRIQGKEFYNLAVPAHGENFMTVKKGNYRLSGNMCEAKYNTSKSIGKNMLVTLTKSPNVAYID